MTFKKLSKNSLYKKKFIFHYFFRFLSYKITSNSLIKYMNNLNKIDKWLKIQKKKQKISVKEKKISDLESWSYNSKKISHNSRKFFSIIGLRVISNFYRRKTWDQPIIFQNENGILGILRRIKNGEPEYLMRANVEPGNINKLQISPSVQATKSNYTRVHGGKKIKYLNFFLKKDG